MRIAALALAGLLALVVAASAHAVALKPCADSKTARCGTLVVPAVRGDPSAGTMRVSFRRYPALAGRALHTLLAIEGGPGYPSAGSAGYYLAMLGPARRTTALVLVDQRGTGELELIDCAPVRRFIATRRVSGSECAADNPALHLVGAFPRTSRTTPEAVSAIGDESFAMHRRAAWCAAQAVADAIARYPLIPETTGAGLRGGRFSARGAYLASRPVTLRLRGVRFCADVAVSGKVLWHRRSGAVRATISFRTAHASLVWSLATQDPAQLRGHVTRAGKSPLAL